MNICISVSICNFFVVNLRKPVVSSNCTGVGKDKTTNRICNCGVFLNTPVVDLNVVVNDLLIVKDCRLNLSYLCSLATVNDVCLCNICVTCLNKNILNRVLNIFNCDFAVVDLGLKVCCNLTELSLFITLYIIKNPFYKFLFFEVRRDNTTKNCGLSREKPQYIVTILLMFIVYKELKNTPNKHKNPPNPDYIKV